MNLDLPTAGKVMREIEAIMRLIVGAALVDGRIDAGELERLRGVAKSVGAGQVLRQVMNDVYAKQDRLHDTADVLAWVREAAEQMAGAGDQTRFVTAYAISQVVREDGHLAPEEADYKEAILAALGDSTADDTRGR